MAVGPIQFAGAVGFRSVAPMAYANPFNGGIISWIGDPNNTWDIVSYVLVGVIVCSGTWLINGAMTFFETRGKTATLSSVLVIGMLVILAQGGKYNPTDWQHTTTAALFVLAYLSACGRIFALSEEDKKDKKK